MNRRKELDVNLSIAIHNYNGCRNSQPESSGLTPLQTQEAL